MSGNDTQDGTATTDVVPDRPAGVPAPDASGAVGGCEVPEPATGASDVAGGSTGASDVAGGSTGVRDAAAAPVDASGTAERSADGFDGREPPADLPDVPELPADVPDAPATEALAAALVARHRKVRSSWLRTPALPRVSVPSVSMPSVSLPSVSVPKVSLPSVSLPKVSMPSVPRPSVSLPSVSLPSVSVPRFGRRGAPADGDTASDAPATAADGPSDVATLDVPPADTLTVAGGTAHPDVLPDAPPTVPVAPVDALVVTGGATSVDDVPGVDPGASVDALVVTSGATSIDDAPPDLYTALENALAEAAELDPESRFDAVLTGWVGRVLEAYPRPSYPMTRQWDVSVQGIVRLVPYVPRFATAPLGLLDRFGAVTLGPDKVGLDGKDVAWDRVLEVRTEPAWTVLSAELFEADLAQYVTVLPPVPGRAWVLRRISELLMSLYLSVLPPEDSGEDLLDDPNADASLTSRVVTSIRYRRRFGTGEATVSAPSALLQLVLPGTVETLVATAHDRGAAVEHVPAAETSVGDIIRRGAAWRRTVTNLRDDLTTRWQR